MKNEKLKTLKELIDSFDTGYYKKRIDDLEKEIYNVSNGIPRYEGIYEQINAEIVPENKRKEEIKRLQNNKKHYEQKENELLQALVQLKSSSSKIENLAEQELLLDVLYHVLRERGSEKLQNTNVYVQNAKKYHKLYLASIKPISHSQQKISREMYKIIKKNMSKNVYKTSYDSYDSIYQSFKENKINPETINPGHEIFRDFQNDYIGFPYSPEIVRLGVDVNLLEYAKKQISGELDSDSLTLNGKEIFGKFKNVERALNANFEVVGKQKLSKLKEEMRQLIELSRETWYLEKILYAFSDTAIVQTEIYKGLQEVVKEQELELAKIKSEVDKLYAKTELEYKINLIEKLEEMYSKTEELRLNIEQFKQKENYRQADLDLMEQEYYEVRYEMIKILKNNPDLNNPKYNIDIKKIIKKEMELFESEIKKSTIKEEPSYIKAEEEKIVIEPKQETEIITEPVVKTAHNIEENNKVESLELDSNLQMFRTALYQDYMREKVLNSDLGKISFSKYLELVAPHLTELINIEKERERLARTIYKDYLKYYSSLENKKYAIEFHEFAGNNYDISNVDVPIEYDEEYKGMMKR